MSGAPSFRTGENGFSLRVPGGPAAAAAARRALGHLRGDFDPLLMENMRLLVTELVGNSVRHAGAACVSVKGVVTNSSVWLQVSDEGPGFEVKRVMRGATQSEETGWGLFLVERLANRWGVRREGDATHVWFELERRA